MLFAAFKTPYAVMWGCNGTFGIMIMVAGLLTAAFGRGRYTQKDFGADTLCAERSFGGGSKQSRWLASTHQDLFQGDVVEMGTLRGVPVVPVLTDFDPAKDSLEILYEPSECLTTGLTSTQSNGSLTVEVNGMAIAHLAGVTQKDMPAIRLVPVR